jgi:hypothetical protein
LEGKRVGGGWDLYEPQSKRHDASLRWDGTDVPVPPLEPTKGIGWQDIRLSVSVALSLSLYIYIYIYIYIFIYIFFFFFWGVGKLYIIILDLEQSLCFCCMDTVVGLSVFDNPHLERAACLKRPLQQWTNYPHLRALFAEDLRK